MELLSVLDEQGMNWSDNGLIIRRKRPTRNLPKLNQVVHMGNLGPEFRHHGHISLQMMDYRDHRGIVASLSHAERIANMNGPNGRAPSPMEMTVEEKLSSIESVSPQRKALVDARRRLDQITHARVQLAQQAFGVGALPGTYVNTYNQQSAIPPGSPSARPSSSTDFRKWAQSDGGGNSNSNSTSTSTSASPYDSSTSENNSRPSSRHAAYRHRYVLNTNFSGNGLTTGPAAGTVGTPPGSHPGSARSRVGSTVGSSRGSYGPNKLTTTKTTATANSTTTASNTPNATTGTSNGSGSGSGLTMQLVERADPRPPASPRQQSRAPSSRATLRASTLGRAAVEVDGVVQGPVSRAMGGKGNKKSLLTLSRAEDHDTNSVLFPNHKKTTVSKVAGLIQVRAVSARNRSGRGNSGRRVGSASSGSARFNSRKGTLVGTEDAWALNAAKVSYEKKRYKESPTATISTAQAVARGERSRVLDGLLFHTAVRKDGEAGPTKTTTGKRNTDANKRYGNRPLSSTASARLRRARQTPNATGV